jgi:hypothetical protein
MRRAIIRDPRLIREIAEDYGVSVGCVKTFKRVDRLKRAKAAEHRAWLEATRPQREALKLFAADMKEALSE